VEGRAHAAILEYGKHHPYDLIVMGSHGRPWYQRLLLGSTAEAVLRTASVPVLIVRNTTLLQHPLQLKKLLLPTDLSVGSTVGIEWGVFFAQHRVEEVVLVHVVENPLIEVYTPDTIDFNLQQIMEESRQHTPRSAQPFWEHAQQVATEELTHLGQQFSGLPVRVEHFTLEGLAADEILTFAEEKGVDLIIMATHGRTGVRHLLLGSMTEKVVRTAPCPVLAVRSKE
jgi:nucleotide-binding universal stress UspA family protein